MLHVAFANPKNKWFRSALLGIFFIVISSAVLAAEPPRSAGMLDDALNLFATGASKWEAPIRTTAEYLFFALGTISLVYTYGTMFLRKADIGEFFSETVRFMLFFGFFMWLLQNGLILQRYSSSCSPRPWG